MLGISVGRCRTRGEFSYILNMETNPNSDFALL